MQFLILFNNKGGVGKTTLVYHLAWMFSLRGYTVLTADIDPQCNLTSAFLHEDVIENNKYTLYTAISPIIEGTGDIEVLPPLQIDNHLALIPGDLRLSLVEDDFSLCWPRAGDGDERSFRVLSSLYRVLLNSAQSIDADIIFIDVGPNLGALNRTALIASDYVITPLAPDMYSLQGLDNLGPQLYKWRSGWENRLHICRLKDVPLPSGKMSPLGYLVMQHSERAGRSTKSYRKWIDRIPAVFHQAVLRDEEPLKDSEHDPFCLARLKHYRSLMPMAMEVRKPVFSLMPADGAFGSHAEAVRNCKKDFERLVDLIADKINLREEQHPDYSGSMPLPEPGLELEGR
ncbi:MAG: ParA family protein [Desulfovibrio sp.]|jgi:cellulose biosynthesis protein BcsQ|nr:ParA family protein [Desulfovibrio sp.]